MLLLLLIVLFVPLIVLFVPLIVLFVPLMLFMTLVLFGSARTLSVVRVDAADALRVVRVDAADALHVARADAADALHVARADAADALHVARADAAKMRATACALDTTRALAAAYAVDQCLRVFIVADVVKEFIESNCLYTKATIDINCALCMCATKECNDANQVTASVLRECGLYHAPFPHFELDRNVRRVSPYRLIEGIGLKKISNTLSSTLYALYACNPVHNNCCSVLYKLENLDKDTNTLAFELNTLINTANITRDDLSGINTMYQLNICPRFYEIVEAIASNGSQVCETEANVLFPLRIKLWDINVQMKNFGF
jgi:hypothetical protein